MERGEILSQTVAWVESQPQVRVAILVGSHAERRPTDELSDYDLSLFCTDATFFVESESWLEDIAKVWVSIPEQFIFQGATIPTRLTIFEGGHKVDFAFYPLEILDSLAKASNLPDEYNMGYKVLVDKDQLTSGIPKPTFEGFKEHRPSEQEFHGLVKEFWFEVYHVAKYLHRQDLWSVQFRLSGIHHNFLLKMICWNEAAKHDWNYTTNSIGKRLREWVCDGTWQALHQLFPHFDADDGWKALSSTTVLFSRLMRETASNLGYGHLPDLESNMGGFLRKFAEEEGKGQRASSDLPSFSIGSQDPVSKAFRQQSVSTFSEALEWTHRLPYGRNSDRADYMLIFAEGCGTCSTKHAALAALCRENDMQAQLQVAICRLDRELEPNVSSFLDELSVDFFPEAHCYLQYAGKDIDVTFPDQSPVLKAKVLQSYPIQPEQIGDHKLALHHEYLRRWLEERGLDKRFTFDEVWRLREAWIESLSE